ncbi:hypothetical protein [Polaribacter cellanae]|uniref:Uncharacterized protein n=1 Tax=Polaribacter cellanae TaxID=2818493 RepID=A0A975CM37_9FLAO|nr:hypothetical protein [Polaribacter cellanae]QTE21829.1 hypothetical protein J3359_13530 [Polaribacter cellanae]
MNLLLGIIIFINLSCTSEDNGVENRNGFNFNGTFYETSFAGTESRSSPYHLIFSNTDNTNLPEAHFGSFYLDSGSDVQNGPLIEGQYSTSNGTNSKFGIHGYQFIHFQDNSNADEVHIASGYWHQDERFISGNVEINSITSTGDDIVTNIDIDYTFKWNSVTVVGHYNGPVINDDF